MLFRVIPMPCVTIVEILVVLFFFQAEAGIRNHCVTGVQTFALPISLRVLRNAKGRLTDATAASGLAGLEARAVVAGDYDKNTERGGLGKRVELGGCLIVIKKKKTRFLRSGGVMKETPSAIRR